MSHQYWTCLPVLVVATCRAVIVTVGASLSIQEGLLPEIVKRLGWLVVGTTSIGLAIDTWTTVVFCYTLRRKQTMSKGCVPFVLYFRYVEFHPSTTRIVEKIIMWTIGVLMH